MVVRGKVALVVRRAGLRAALLLLGSTLWPTALWAVKATPRISWVRGEGYLQSERAPARFFPGQILDGKAATITCFSAAKETLAQASITIGFGGRAGVRELRIINGDMRSRAAFAKSARVAKLTLLEPEYERSIMLADTGMRQTIRLDPPLMADRVTLRIDEVQGEGARVCLTDIIFVRGKKALNGPSLARQLRWRGLASRLQGSWAAGPLGAAEKYLTLSLDGRYRFAYRPNDPDMKGLRIDGRWSVVGKRLRLLGGGAPATFRLKLGRDDNERGQRVRLLEVQGIARGKKKILPDRYRDRD